MRSIRMVGAIVDRENTSGFDYLRLGLSISVLAWHSAGIVYGRDFSIYLATTYLGNLVFLIIPAFFSLSGFLVSGSLVRSSSLAEFLGLRLLRLIPALSVEICLSALILGPLLTSFSISDYIADPKFFSYFLNIFGLIHYKLPGIFEINPIKEIVNGSLWTVPYEMECYIVLAVLWIIRLKSSKTAAICALIGWTALLYLGFISGMYDPIAPDAVNGRMLVSYFLAGVCLYHVREHLPHDGRLFAVMLALSLLMIKSKTMIFLSPLVVAYVTIYVGVLRPKKLPVVFTGDYSYGIYLYAFPVQQAVWVLVPGVRIWGLHFALALALTALLATFSWHLIEKPMLKLKRMLKSTNAPV